MQLTGFPFRATACLFAASIALAVVGPLPAEAQSGFAGDFAPSNWSMGENPPGRGMIETNAPTSITIRNYSPWAVSGAGISYMRDHAAGTVTFTYTITGGFPACPASYVVGDEVQILPTPGSQTSFQVAANESFGFALNGLNRPGNFGCQGAGYQNVEFTISDFSFTETPTATTTLGFAQAPARDYVSYTWSGYTLTGLLRGNPCTSACVRSPGTTGAAGRYAYVLATTNSFKFAKTDGSTFDLHSMEFSLLNPTVGAQSFTVTGHRSSGTVSTIVNVPQQMPNTTHTFPDTFRGLTSVTWAPNFSTVKRFTVGSQ